MAEPYYAGNQRAVESTVLGVPRAVDRPMTEMENLTAQMADTARRMTTTAERLQERLDNFMQSNQAITGSPEKNPEPQPGTFAAMRFWHSEIDKQAARLADTAGALAGIL